MLIFILNILWFVLGGFLAGQFDGFAERFLFPGVIREGLLVQGFIEEGLWVDVGSPERYLRATALLMAGERSVEREVGGIGVWAEKGMERPRVLRFSGAWRDQPPERARRPCG